MSKIKVNLIPDNGRKSYYGKAVLTVDGGLVTLYSYDTPVAEIIGDTFNRLWDGYSTTTMKHVNTFRHAYGLNSIGKSEWNALPVKKIEKRNGPDMTPAESYRAMIARRNAG